MYASMRNVEYYDLKKKYWLPIQYTIKGISIMRNDTFVASVNGLIYIVSIVYNFFMYITKTNMPHV